MSWRQSLFPVLILVLAGCAIGPPATPTPTTAQSVAEALRMAAEGGLPLDLIHIRYEIGSEAWQGRTVLDIDGSGSVQVTFDHTGRHEEWTADLNQDELGALYQLLVDQQVWDIEGQRETGVPDEAYPVVTVRVADLEPLTVGMWHNEALENARFAAIMHELAGLAFDISDGQAK